MSTRTRFEKGAKGNSVMAYSLCLLMIFTDSLETRRDNAQRTGIDDIGSDRCGFNCLILQFFAVVVVLFCFSFFFCHEIYKLEVSLPHAVSHLSERWFVLDGTCF